MLSLNEKLSEVQLLRLRATFHALPLFYLRNKFYASTHVKITRHWKSTVTTGIFHLRDYSENLIHKPRHCQTVIGYFHDDDIKNLLYYLN